MLIHKVSLIMPLPVSYQTRLQQTRGVELASHQTWFGGVYQDPSNFFANIAVEPDLFLKIYPEFRVPPEQVKAWLADRQGAIVGRDLAEPIRLEDRRPRSPDRHDLAAETGWQTWEFNIVGIYDGDDGVDKTQFLLQIRLPRRESSAGPGHRRLVRRENRRSVAGRSS